MIDFLINSFPFADSTCAASQVFSHKIFDFDFNFSDINFPRNFNIDWFSLSKRIEWKPNNAKTLHCGKKIFSQSEHRVTNSFKPSTAHGTKLFWRKRRVATFWCRFLLHGIGSACEENNRRYLNARFAASFQQNLQRWSLLRVAIGIKSITAAWVSGFTICEDSDVLTIFYLQQRSMASFVNTKVSGYSACRLALERRPVRESNKVFLHRKWNISKFNIHPSTRKRRSCCLEFRREHSRCFQ